MYVSRVKWSNCLLHIGVVAIVERTFASPSTPLANFTYIYIEREREKEMDRWEKMYTYMNICNYGESERK